MNTLAIQRVMESVAKETGKNLNCQVKNIQCFMGNSVIGNLIAETHKAFKKAYPFYIYVELDHHEFTYGVELGGSDFYVYLVLQK